MLLNCIISFSVILIFAFSLHANFNLKSSVTPIVSLALLIDINIIFAMFGFLKQGVWATYVLAFIFLILAVYKNKENLYVKIKSFLSPGVVLFIIASLAMLAFMYLRQPLMTEWDEFSFWGISKKLMKIHERLYTYYPSSMIGNSTPPALGVLSYYFQWATPEFAEWICFFSYDVMFFACYSAFTAAFDKKNWNSAFMVYLFGFMLPYFFEVYTKIIYLEPVYMTTYADVPLGVMFAGILAVYVFSEEGGNRSILPTLPVIFMLTMIKDMGLVLSCVAAFIIFFDLVVKEREFKLLKVKGFFGKILAGFLMVFTAGVSFISWSLHMAKVMQRNPFELGGATNMGQVEMLITGIKELLIGPKSYKFATIEKSMVDALFNSKICMIGSGIFLIFVITALFAISFFLSDRKGKRRTISMYITSVIGFTGYYIFHLFLYVYIFKDNAYGLPSYNRYIYPYYMGWLALALFSICLAVRDSKNTKKFMSKSALFGFVGAVFVLFNIYISYDNIFVECKDRSFSIRLDIKKKVEYIKDSIGDDDVIYLYCGDDNGERWFIYTHEFAENIIIEEKAVDVEGLSEEEKKEKYQKTFYERFKQLGVTNVMVDKTSPVFESLFGDLFDEGLEDIGRGSIGYYKVIYEDDWYRFELIKGGEVQNA